MDTLIVSTPCSLIEKMNPEQLGRSLRDPKIGPILFDHTRHCVAKPCEAAFMEVVRLVGILSWRMDTRPRDDRWKSQLTYAAELYVVSEKRGTR